MKDGINVLSLFDGMSGGQQALDRLGVKVDRYYASEIDKYAIAVTQYNYPDTIQLGNITKWKEWDIDWESIDLVIGGSPCQGLSSSGKGEGLLDSRSKLFWEWVDIRDHVVEHNPDAIFLLENVVPRKREWQDNMTINVGIEPVMINSSLLSAQSRKRLYWTNIDGIEQPKDKFIYLQDIIESVDPDSIKSYCIDANYFKGGNLKQYFEKSRRQLVFDTPVQVGHVRENRRGTRIYDINGKSVTLTANGGGWGAKTGLYVTGAAERVRYDEKGESFIKTELRDDNKSNAVIAGNRRKYLAAISSISKEDYRTAIEQLIESGDLVIRMLTPIECERLQTVEDDYTKYGNFSGKVKEISKTQRYKILGNGWTIDVIAHIFSFIPQIKSGEWVKK